MSLDGLICDILFPLLPIIFTISEHHCKLNIDQSHILMSTSLQ